MVSIKLAAGKDRQRGNKGMIRAFADAGGGERPAQYEHGGARILFCL